MKWINNVCTLSADQVAECEHKSSDDNLCCHHHHAVVASWSSSGRGDYPLHPNTDGGAPFTVSEIHPLDVRDEIEYVSARFEAVAAVAAMQKPIKEDDSSNRNNRKPRRAREIKRNPLGPSLKWKCICEISGCLTSHLTAWPDDVWPSTCMSPTQTVQSSQWEWLVFSGFREYLRENSEFPQTGPFLTPPHTVPSQDIRLGHSLYFTEFHQQDHKLLNQDTLSMPLGCRLIVILWSNIMRNNEIIAKWVKHFKTLTRLSLIFLSTLQTVHAD